MGQMKTSMRGFSPAVLLVVVLATACCSFPAAKATPTPSRTASTLANPASVNCIRQGGALSIQKRADGGEYGVCTFTDGRQCEEWAMFRGECPAGGIKITGYVTDAARYCAMTGGVYQVAGKANADGEEGTCNFKNGRACDARAYFAGRCGPHGGPDQGTYSDPFAYCRAVTTVDVPDGRYTGQRMPDAIVQEMIRQGVVSGDAPRGFQRSAVWRCMDGQVWACHFGANLPCLEKADTSRTATTAMEDFCKAHPAGDRIPAVVTGRATVYTWRCRVGKPEADRQVFQVDPRGYLADLWHKLVPREGVTP